MEKVGSLTCSLIGDVKMADGGRLFCENCVKNHASFATVDSESQHFCKFCADLDVNKKIGGKFIHKIYPSDSPRQSPEPPSPNCVSDRFHGCSLQAVSVRHSSGRSDEDEADDSSKTFFSPYSNDTSDVDSISTRHEFNSILSVGSSPTDSPSRIHCTSKNPKHFVHHEEHETPRFSDNDSKNEDNSYDDLSIFEDQLNFENNGVIWFPPPPDDQNNDEENNFFSYTDNDDEMGESGVFSCSDGVFTEKDKREEQKKPLRTVVQGHFRALVSQLLQSEMVSVEEWLDIITFLAWDAANFVKPDTSRGGSMDPGDYVKIKCIASGSPSESTFVKGVVCTKNIKHKRMTSQYTNPRLLILGGALEYQRSNNQLASIETLLQQEMDNLKMVVSKIEAHRPNVLLVEKSVSSYAQEYLLAKDISLVSNVKLQLLERISRCTGAPITPSTDKICSTKLGQCELFKLEKLSEEHDGVDQFNKKPSKTLMFFEGCPWRLGCTVLLKGSSREELKKVKHVVQYAIFAAYHLSLETSFLADEGATLPKMTILPSMTEPERMNELHDSIDHQNSSLMEDRDVNVLSCPSGDIIEASGDATVDQDERKSTEFDEQKRAEKLEVIDTLNEYYSANDNQSILVSYSSRCVLNGTVCERPRLLRIKFYGCFDKPLGRYLQDDLFDKNSLCRSCKEPTEAHVVSYTHQHGNLTINVRRLKSLNRREEKDGKIWMWHRCLRCTHVDGVPPTTRRVVMSDAAWGLSLGKFLELSFSNHETANRVASCGHSLQKDCLRFYGFGSMVAVFHYSPIDILSVHLPPSVLEFNGHVQQDWLKKEVSELLTKTEALYEEIIDVLHGIEQKSTSYENDSSDSIELNNHIMELKDELINEKQDYVDLLQSPNDNTKIDVFELNRLRHSLMIGLHVWDRRLLFLNSLYGQTSNRKLTSDTEVKPWRTDSIDFDSGSSQTELMIHSVFEDSRSSSFTEDGGAHEGIVHMTSLERAPSAASVLSDKIDSAWAGAGPLNAPVHHEPSLLRQMNRTGAETAPFQRLFQLPARVYSFESALKPHEKIKKELTPSSLYLSTLRSFHASGDYVHMVKDYNISRSFSHAFPGESQPSNSFVSKMSVLPDGVRLMYAQNDVVIAVYDNEPTSIIAYALASNGYGDRVDDQNGSGWQSFGSVDFDFIRSYGSEDPQNSPHLTVPFEDESGINGKVKFSVTCYFAKRFDGLRRKCCPSEVDFVRSMSRCKRWNAQGGKSNVYFAKSMDERFIIKQVTKTEMEAFEEFAPQYFKYLTDSLDSGSPTCLAKIVGIYQVTVKHLRGGKEAKMNVMVMENVFYERNISRIYDLKGSSRSRYNADTTGTNKTMLDMNLLETLHTNPIFLGSKAKRTLERAVWNDTSFLASIDVMDYSLLVGVDDEKKELVLGIIDFMRQYTWDKHLETWVKASGILGGPKNASPTIVSPIQYKRRFRKAMTSYFLTVPDQWSS